MKKISIIMPVYNTVSYLDRSAGSVMKQTYQNLELICIDDGSTDGSAEKLDMLAEQDARIRVLHKPNAGVADARNDGLKLASGDYIGFLDSDDYISPTMYEELASCLETHNADMVTSGYCFDRDGVIKEAKNADPVEEKVYDCREILRYVYERDRYTGVAGYLWTKLIRREVLFDEQNALRFPFEKQYDGADDIVFIAELHRQAENVYYLAKPLYYYFQREGSITHNDVKNLKHLHWIQAYQRIIGMYEEDGIDAETMGVIYRMYVYRCARTLETAIRYHDKEKTEALRALVIQHADIYKKTNQAHPDRIAWLEELIRT